MSEKNAMSDLPPDGAPTGLEDSRDREPDSPSGDAGVSFSDIFDRAVTAPRVAEFAAPTTENNPLWTSAYEALARITGHSQQLPSNEDQRSNVRRQDTRAEVAPAVQAPHISDANRRVLPPPSIQRDDAPPVISFRSDKDFRTQASLPSTAESTPILKLAANPDLDSIPGAEKLAKGKASIHDSWQPATVTQTFNPSVDLSDMATQFKVSKASLSDFKKTPDTAAGANPFVTTVDGSAFKSSAGEAKRIEAAAREMPPTQMGSSFPDNSYTTMSASQDSWKTMALAKGNTGFNEAMKIAAVGNGKLGEPMTASTPFRDFGGTGGTINRQITGEPGFVPASYLASKGNDFKKMEDTNLRGTSGSDLTAMMTGPTDKYGYNQMWAKLNEPSFGNTGVLTSKPNDHKFGSDFNSQLLSRDQSAGPITKDYFGKDLTGISSADRQIAGNPFLSEKPINGLTSGSNPFMSDKVTSLVGTSSERLAGLGLASANTEKLATLSQNGAATFIRVATENTVGNVTISANADLALTRALVKPVSADITVRSDAAATTLSSRALNINIEKTTTSAPTLGTGIKLVMANNIAADTTRVASPSTAMEVRGFAPADKVPGVTLASTTMHSDRVLSDRALASRMLTAPITALPQQLADRVASAIGEPTPATTMAARTALLTGETGIMLGNRLLNLPIDRLATTANGTQSALTRGNGIFTIENASGTTNASRVVSFAPERNPGTQPAATLGERAVNAAANPALSANDRAIRTVNLAGATERGAAIVGSGERAHGHNGVNTDRVVKAIDQGNGDRAGAQPVVGTGRANIRDITAHGVRDGLIDKSNLQIGLADNLVAVGSKVIALKPLHQISENDKRYLTGIELAAGIVALAAIARARSIEASADDENKEGSDDEVQAAQTSDDYDSNVIQRPKHMVQPGETLTTIAEEYYNDANLAWLILSLNKGKVAESWKGDICYVEVNGRQELELPVGEDISHFYKVMAGRFKDKRIVTSVRQSHMDQEIVTLAFRNVVGRGRRLQSASS